ncbi:glucuronate isomerase [Ructibacterium gallinarum]|uniref:Uronate isomerase n=1 Tax=Ructibacterium gallinarum TaxID=2779355 RepID=A0A9D5R876_9FIRM|nr:glucuronate isomerase [Ructibacterium gallinarum]MBE5040121.1 glucuronate isomerase [Ructibacterium gallinarum]
MKQFMDENFMLQTEMAVKLYHDFAADMPIFDYHCHLNPQEMYEDQPFKNITQLFLGGDHYKWRYMRSCGIDEEYITGNQPDKEKFRAFCTALQYGIGNPLYHWTHLELKRYFNIDTIIREDTADQIWQNANAKIQNSSMRPSSFINESNVAVICTTDDPIDSLIWHKKIREKGHMKASVLPAFRPDKILQLEKPDFPVYITHLGESAGISISCFEELIQAIYSRMEYFHQMGCRVSDHGLEDIPFAQGEAEEIDTIFQKALSGEPLSPYQQMQYKTAILTALGRKYHELGWVMQLHYGAIRNNNTRMFEKLGADTGYDSVGDAVVAKPLSRLLDSLEQEGMLPKTILYTLNPKDNYVLGTMLGNFQSSETAGKIQFGSGWWFNDQRDGMETQMKTLANLGALCKFVGMLTDSRSFLSYTRHEYFRRILCNLLGTWVENGEFPADMDTLGKIVQDICFNNAKNYFGINC